MGLVYTDQPFDDTYSSEVITKICELSQDLDEYVSTQAYLLETVEENVTSAWLRNKLVCKLVEELASNGIVFASSADDICDSPLLVAYVIRVRAKFDQDRLFELLKDNRDLTEFFRSVTDDADCIGELISYCHDNLPLDEGWDLLASTLEDKPGLVESTADFKTNILDPVFERIDMQGEPDVITGDNRDVVENYIKIVADRKAKVALYAKQMYCCKVSTEGLESGSSALEGAVEGLMTGFEKELARANLIEGLDPVNKTIPLGEFRSAFLGKWPHTLEYYCLPEHAGLMPTKLQVCVMVATMFVDHGATVNARVKVIEDFENMVPALGQRADKFRELFDEALGNLALVQERSEVTNVPN